VNPKEVYSEDIRQIEHDQDCVPLRNFVLAVMSHRTAVNVSYSQTKIELCLFLAQ
jgi:uncharacterized membrane protein YGL010W